MGCVCVGNKMIINPKLNQNKLQKYKLLDKNWKKILNYLSKNDLKEVGTINKYFHNLIFELNYYERKTEVDDKNIEILKYPENIKQKQVKEKLFLSNNNDKIIREKLTLSPNLNFKKYNIKNINSNKKILNINNSALNNKYLNTEIIENERKIGGYFDIFTNMKIYVQSKNNQFQNSSISDSSLSYNGTPTFSDNSNKKSIINSNFTNHYKIAQLNQNNNNSYVQKEKIFPENTKMNI